MTYRNDLDALEARKSALDAQVREVTRERDEAGQLLSEARARTHLPVLPNIRIASPCSEPWDDMTGDERVRHCAKCDKDVYNLSALTEHQAESLILERAGSLCARYYQRKDGTILLADCEIGRSGVRKRRYVAAGMALLLGGAASTAVAAHHDDHHDDQHDLRAMSGGLAYTPEDQPPPSHWADTGIESCDLYGDAVYSYFWCHAVTPDAAAALMDSFRQTETALQHLPADQRDTAAKSCDTAREELEARAQAASCPPGVHGLY